MSNRYVILDNRAVLAITGADARSFLQGLVTQDIDLLTAQQSLYAALLSAQGKYLFDFFLVQQPDAIWLECEKERLPVLLRLLTLYRLRAQVKFQPLDGHHVLAALGDMAPLALFESEGRTERFHEGQITAFIDPRHVALGARIIAPAGEGETWLNQRGFSQTSDRDYNRHRLQLGLPDSVTDNVPEKTLLLENGFEELHGVSFTKGCYVGQEVTARSKHRASLHKLLYIVEGESLPAPGTPILAGDREVGQMRSSQGEIGLALLRRDAVAAGGLTVEGRSITARLPEWRATE